MNNGNAKQNDGFGTIMDPDEYRALAERLVETDPEAVVVLAVAGMGVAEGISGGHIVYCDEFGETLVASLVGASVLALKSYHVWATRRGAT